MSRHSRGESRSRAAPESDVELLLRVARGDRGAFDSFYGRHAGLVLGFVAKMLGRGPQAEDVVQETFWHVWTHADQYRPDRASPLGWLLLVTRSRAIDQLRRSPRTIPVNPEEEIQAPGDPTDVVESAELAGAAREALANLPANQRRTIQFAFYEGMTHQQIARREGVPIGTVKTWIRRGMGRLRETLNGRGMEVDS